MIIDLYVNTSENNKVLKNITPVTELEGTLRTPTSLLNPSVEVAGIDMAAQSMSFKVVFFTIIETRRV